MTRLWEPVAIGTIPTPGGTGGRSAGGGADCSGCCRERADIARRSTRWSKGFDYPADRCDGARVADCDFSPDTSRVARLQREWEVLVEGAAQREGEDFISIWKPEYYLQRYGDKETYIRRETAFSTYAFVTADGAWHEQGRMGWFGFDDATNESMNQYEKEFQAYLQEARENGLAITIVDCHI